LIGFGQFGQAVEGGIVGGAPRPVGRLLVARLGLGAIALGVAQLIAASQEAIEVKPTRRLTRTEYVVMNSPCMVVPYTRDFRHQ